MILYAIRHSLTTLNEEKKIQGRIDLPLSVYGISHAHALFSELSIDVDEIFSSPLIRAHQTASIAAIYLKYEKPINLIQAFVERDFGSLDLLPVSESKPVVRGETFLTNYEDDASLLHRVQKGLQIIKTYYDHVNSLLICHAHVLKALLIISGEKNISFADTIIMHDDLLQFEIVDNHLKFISIEKIKSDISI
jgi:broad specificity phosphatase PhoE